VCGTVRFGDGPVVHIEGCRMIIFSYKNNEQRSFSDIDFIPKLKMNILSVRQLNEIGYKILIKPSVLSIRNAEKRMLAKISCAPNEFYVLDATIIQLVFFLAHGEEDAWWLPARLGNLNF
jgi:hypothetical protein